MVCEELAGNAGRFGWMVYGELVGDVGQDHNLMCLLNLVGRLISCCLLLVHCHK
jgi:hypothetical protein